MVRKVTKCPVCKTDYEDGWESIPVPSERFGVEVLWVVCDECGTAWPGEVTFEITNNCEESKQLEQLKPYFIVRNNGKPGIDSDIPVSVARRAIAKQALEVEREQFAARYTNLCNFFWYQTHPEWKPDKFQHTSSECRALALQVFQLLGIEGV